MIIDASDLILGRLATHAAKNALTGKQISVVNCEGAVITGGKADVMNKYKARRKRGGPFQGPFFPRRPEMFVKRAIRGMLPYKKTKGREALQRIKCYVGVPDDFKEKKLQTFEEANVDKIPNRKFVTVKDICKELGAK